MARIGRMRRAGSNPATERAALGVVAGALLACGVVFAWPDDDVAFAALVSEVRADEQPAAATLASGAPCEGAASVEGQIERRDDSPFPDPAVVDAVVDDPRIGGLVDALRDDDIPRNCLVAYRTLLSLPPGRIGQLEGALRSYDEQQRMFAGVILRHRCEARVAAVSPDLLDVSVEALSSFVRTNVTGTAAEPLRGTSLRFLLHHAEAAAPMLRRALWSGDVQQRFLAAFALAPVANADDVPAIARELVGRLEDNEVLGDALMAGHGLYRLGSAALPILRHWRGHVDEQARGMIDLIELDLLSPPRDRATLRERGRGRRISTLYHDPVIEFDLERSPVPRL